MGSIIAAATGLVTVLFVGELGGLVDRLAAYVLGFAGRIVPGEVRDDFREDWYAELRVLGSGWAKLLFATSLVFHAFRIRRIIKKSRPRKVGEDKQGERRHFYRTVMFLGILTSSLAILLVATLTATSLIRSSVTVADLLAATAALNGIVIAFVTIFTVSHRGKISVDDEEDGDAKNGAVGERVDK